MLCVEYQTAHELLETTYLKVFFVMLESPLNRLSSCKSCASILLREPSRTDVKVTLSPHTPLAMIKQTIQARCWKCQKNTDTLLPVVEIIIIIIISIFRPSSVRIESSYTHTFLVFVLCK
jgi:hypothetical protein